MLTTIIDVAFNNNVEKKTKLSCGKALDIQFGVYRDGRLTISFKPSHGWKDWLINLLCWSKDGYHYGYYTEWQKCRDKVFDVLGEAWASEAAAKGLILSGRSKGAGEVLISAEDILEKLNHTPNVILGGLGAPKVVTEKVMDRFRFIRDSMLFTVYKNDIVPRFFPWFVSPPTVQLGSRTHGLSVKDHETGTTDEEAVYVTIS